MLRMVKGLDPVRFSELQLTLVKNEKMALGTMPRTMLEALELINELISPIQYAEAWWNF
jgi:hypothetical protein